MGTYDYNVIATPGRLRTPHAKNAVEAVGHMLATEASGIAGTEQNHASSIAVLESLLGIRFRTSPLSTVTLYFSDENFPGLVGGCGIGETIFRALDATGHSPLLALTNGYQDICAKVFIGHRSEIALTITQHSVTFGGFVVWEKPDATTTDN